MGSDQPTRLSATLKLVRTVGTRLSTPLLPDDYLGLINPLWSARRLRGRIVEVIQETEDAATLVIRPGWGWSFDCQAGQFIGIGVEVDGRFHWRSYSLTSPPHRGQRHITITVKAMPEGFLSRHLVRNVEPGTVVRLALPDGEFVLPDPPPPKILFLTGGSGVTPIIGILRTLDRRHTMPDVVMVHQAPTPEASLFRDELEALARSHPALRLHQRFTDETGILSLDELDSLCPDWADRQTWACGPPPMLADVEGHWERHRCRSRLHLERFTTELSARGEGGHVVFSRSGKEADVDGATTLLQAGEELGIDMPFGCRMGICHTCVVPLEAGAARDLRNGNESATAGEGVQTCISAAAGDCTLAI